MLRRFEPYPERTVSIGWPDSWCREYRSAAWTAPVTPAARSHCGRSLWPSPRSPCTGHVGAWTTGQPVVVRTLDHRHSRPVTFELWWPCQRCRKANFLTGGQLRSAARGWSCPADGHLVMGMSDKRTQLAVGRSYRSCRLLVVYALGTGFDN